MRVFIYTTTPFPFGNAGTNRVFSLAYGFVQNNVDVEVIIISRTELKSKIINEKREGVYENVKFRYISNSTVKSGRRYIRAIFSVKDKINTLFHIIKNRKSVNAVIVIGGGTFDFRNIIPCVTCLYGIHSILEINEYPFVKEITSISGKIKYYIFKRLSLPYYDGFIVISSLLETFANLHKKEKSWVIKVPIITSPIGEFNAECGVPFNQPYIIHSGSLFDDKDGIISTIYSFYLANIKLEKKLKFVIAGDIESSPDKSKIIDLIKNLGIRDEIIFLGYLTPVQLHPYLINSSLAIVNKPDNLQNRAGFNTKISDYIRYKIPLILSNVGENAKYFRNGVNAILVAPNNSREISEGIIRLILDRKLRSLLIENALKLSLHDFNPDKNVKKIIDKFK